MHSGFPSGSPVCFLLITRVNRGLCFSWWILCLLRSMVRSNRPTHSNLFDTVCKHPILSQNPLNVKENIAFALVCYTIATCDPDDQQV